MEFRKRRLTLYQTKARFYLIGRTSDKKHWRVAKFSRLEDSELQASDDPTTYTESECQQLLTGINDGNRTHGGLSLVLQADALIGCFKFLEGYYLLLVTQKRLAGNICGARKVYSVADIRLVSLKNQSEPPVASESRDERRYRKVLSGVELTKNFFFSYTYPLWRTVQANLSTSAVDDPWSSMFVWNNFLTRPLRQLIDSSAWVTPLIHGFWQQRTLAVFGQTLTITLIARRSKHFAGTRYRKRGINDQGHVANDVETEQVISAGFDWRTGFPIISTIVQVRGSIPLFWIQDNTQRKLKPDILLQRFDPLFDATALHFKDLSARYGSPTVVLNLVKSVEKRPRETLLRQEFANAISHINDQRKDDDKIQYIPWDFNYWAKQRGGQILTHIAPVIRTGLKATGFFVCAPAGPSAQATRSASCNQEPELSMQRGVLRTNCIDCLDRTNVAQFALGLHALGRQLCALGISDTDVLDTRSGIAVELMGLYEHMGNVLAIQYGGSEAHSTVFKRERGDWEYATSMRDKLTSLRRFYSNTYTDAEKQDALNLFLGNFVPAPNQPAIWELQSDYYLHSGLGQRFLHNALAAKARRTSDEERSRVASDPEYPSETTPLLPAMPSSPLSAGHSQGEGVRDLAALLADSSLNVPVYRASHVEQASRTQLAWGASVGMDDKGSDAAHILKPLQRAVQEFQPGAHDEQRRSSQATCENAIESGQDPGTAADVADSRMAQARMSRPPESPRSGRSGDNSAEPSGQAATMPWEAGHVLATTKPEPNRLPPLQSGEDGSQMRGILRFRAPTTVGKRAKLESFDRKIGRQPNTIQEVRLHVASDRTASYLPQWLASPLGMARTPLPSPAAHPIPPTVIIPSASAKKFHAGAQTVPPRRGSLDSETMARQNPVRRNSFAAVPTHTLQHAASAMVHTGPAALSMARPSLERRSADAHPALPLAPLGKPIFRSSSEAGLLQGVALRRKIAAQSMKEALSRVTVNDADPLSPGVASPPSGYTPFHASQLHHPTGGGRDGDLGGMRRTLESVWESREQPSRLAASHRARPFTADMAGGLTSRLGQSMSMGALTDAAPLPGVPQLDDALLGMSPGLYAWWSGSLDVGTAWAQEEDQARASYTKLLDGLGSVQLDVTRSTEAAREYEDICSKILPLSMLLLAPEEEIVYRHRCGISGTQSWGEAALKSLAFEQTLPQPAAAVHTY